MKKEDLITFMKSVGWEVDRYGHLQKTVTRRRPHVDYPVGQEPLVSKTYRIKLQATSCRLEVRSEIYKEWIRIGGDYYSKIVEFSDNSGIRIGSDTFRKAG